MGNTHLLSAKRKQSLERLARWFDDTQSRGCGPAFALTRPEICADTVVKPHSVSRRRWNGLSAFSELMQTLSRTFRFKAPSLVETIARRHQGVAKRVRVRIADHWGAPTLQCASIATAPRRTGN